MAQSSPDLFDSQGDEIMSQAFIIHEWKAIAEEAISNKSRVQFIMETHLGHETVYTAEVAEVEELASGQCMFHFIECQDQGKRRKPTISILTDDIMDFKKCDEESQQAPLPDTDQSSSIEVLDHDGHEDLLANDEEWQLMQNQPQATNTPEQGRVHTSSPNRWADDITTPDLSPIRQASPESVRELPILANGIEVDRDYLIKLWEHEAPGTTFTQWCTEVNITKQMEKQDLVFGNSIKYNTLIQTEPETGFKLYDLWLKTFDTHYLMFDDWYAKEHESPSLLKHKASKRTIDIVKFHNEALQQADTAEPQEREKMHKLRVQWAQSLVKVHYLSFSEWLESPLSSTEASKMVESLERVQLQDIPSKGPYKELFHYDEKQTIMDSELQSDFISDERAVAKLQSSRAFRRQIHFSRKTH
jgi:hypothetical protein